MAAAVQPQVNPADFNAAVRNLIIHGGVMGNTYYPPALDMWQELNPSLTSGFTTGSTLTQVLRNVGLVKRVVVKLQMTVTAGAQDLTLTPWGMSNAFSQVIFTDLANNQRINTTGDHLVDIASAKRRRPFMSAATTDSPFGMGNVFRNVQQAPTTIAAGTSAVVNLMMEVPFAYDDMNLSGAVFADVTQSNMQVALTLNSGFTVSSTTDPTLAVYQSAGAATGSVSAITMQMTQNYLDQLPRMANGQPILPPLDLATAYMLTNASSGLPIANQDNAYSYTNARQFLSTIVAFDNAGTLNTGSDINYLAIQSANLTSIIKSNPFLIAGMGRLTLGDDFPKGKYYFNHRHRPIDTNQYGNMQIVVNPSSVGGATAVLLYRFEAFGVIGLVNQGGSLASGGG
jgi:hypothetical protein